MSKTFFTTLGVIRVLGAVITTALHYDSFIELGIGMTAATLVVLNLDILIAAAAVAVLSIIRKIRH